MGIFSTIKNAVFGGEAKAATPASPGIIGSAAAAAISVAQDAAATVSENVDIAARMDALAAENPQELNWRSSIVDLMKLTGMESSLQERKDLAMELGYTGELAGSAEMNMWLHKQVLRELAANGGVVPAELLD
ncbi:MAG: DUF3597 domain-containing protein [Sphingorhabdus sp.]